MNTATLHPNITSALQSVWFRYGAMLALAFIALLMCPELMAQQLPDPPDGQGGTVTDGDWMSALGKLAFKGGGFILIFLAVACCIVVAWYIVMVINEVRTNKADMAKLAVAVLIGVLGLVISGAFAKYGLDMLDTNKQFLEGS